MSADIRSLFDPAAEARDDGAQGDAAAFEAVLRQCRPELMAYLCSRLQNPADAEDLAQETCTRVLQYRDDPAIADMRMMLFRIANNVLTDHYRRSDRRCVNDHVALDAIGPLQAPERPQADRVADRDALDRLRRTIARLPRKCQLAFMLSRFDGLPHRQIADRMGISVKMVEKHIARALRACQSAVGDRDA